MAIMVPTQTMAYDFSSVAPSGQTLYYSIYDDGMVVVVNNDDYSNLTGALTIPSSVTYGGNAYTVIGIYDNAFEDCRGMTSVTIPNTVYYIGEGAFRDCVGLTGTLTILANDTYFIQIGDYAFSGCHGLTSLIIADDAVNDIGEGAFNYCESLDNVKIPGSVTHMEADSFQGCFDLTTVYYGGTVADWCQIDFENSTSNPLFYADNMYVNYATAVTDLVIPSGVIAVKQYAFCGADFFSSITIPTSVTSIGNSAFWGCDNVCSVSVPNSVVSINSNAFYEVRCVIYNGSASGRPWGANNSTETGYAEGDFIYSNAAKTCLVSCCKFVEGDITIPSTVDTIGAKAFYHCDGITSVAMPSVVEIDDEAFYSCSNMTSVSLGSSVTYIGKRAFGYCGMLAEIHSAAIQAPSVWDDYEMYGYGNYNSFYNVRNTIPIYIPCGSWSSYYSRWDYFSNFIEEGGFEFSAVSENPSMGTVQIISAPTCTDTTAVVVAAAKSGYRFDHWSDGSTANPYTLTVTTDMTLTAHFVSAGGGTQGIYDITSDQVKIHSRGSEILIEGIDNSDALVYDVMGRIVHKGRIEGPIHVNNTGVYMVKIANQKPHKVVVR